MDQADDELHIKIMRAKLVRHLWGADLSAGLDVAAGKWRETGYNYSKSGFLSESLLAPRNAIELARSPL